MLPPEGAEPPRVLPTVERVLLPLKILPREELLEMPRFEDTEPRLGVLMLRFGVVPRLGV